MIREKISAFLTEDVFTGDLSTDLVFAENEEGIGQFLAKSDGIIAGLEIGQVVYDELAPGTATFTPFVNDGDKVTKGTVVATATGRVRTLLSAERVILNLMQRMSAIATATHNHVEALNDPTIRIVDTRKTLPGLRIFDKKAVKIGGGANHRFGLYDGVMLKDNHIAYAGGIKPAVEKVREGLGHMVKIEVEIESREQLLEAIDANADVIMFDNRTPEEVREFVALTPAHIITEISGGINLDNIANYAGTGAKYISIGSITNAPTLFDISYNSSFAKLK
ncbi:MAG: carboxylating nicotinate-nucleotide diphosphorylase [Lactobacillales bacterium]|jgi:nicotinate-nucleotide pyrophosphorylase (carboxylating)|nr:carboxylating nicotinate-nucleotide diphosphorylase [Lactobacillales bacterium]